VINCSWGRAGFYSQVEQDVVTAVTQSGSLIVAAAGNDSVNVDFNPAYPASYEHVLAVGATRNTSDARAVFSNYGVTVPVFAPGTGIAVATNGGKYTSDQGTSFSSPLVAGLAGLVKSVHPTWSPGQIAAQIRMTADSIDEINASHAGSLGRGRVNFLRAVTESHSGLEIISATAQTPSGRTVFLPGDTIQVAISVRNLLQPASNVSFSVTPSNSILSTMQGAAAVASIGSGEETALPTFQFLVGSLTSPLPVFFKIAWVANGNERDASGFKVYLFPSPLSWELESSPPVSSLASIWAVDTNVVWAAGGGGSVPIILRTANGGVTWSNATGNLTGVDIYCIAGADSLHGWTGSADGRIFATTNGGGTWTEQAYPGTQSPFIDGIRFFDPQHGFALGDPGNNLKYVLLATSDGGQTWSHLPGEPTAGSTEAGWNNSFAWSDPQHGWFGSNVSRIYRTTNGGVSWTSSLSGAANSLAIAFGDSLNGIAGHDDGTASVTSNGGATWHVLNVGFAGGVFGAAYVPGTSYIWLATPTTPYRSTDGGTTWVSETAYPVRGSIDHISFADTLHGWGVTSDGEVLRYRIPTFLGNPSTGRPTVFRVYPNYPNPFNGSTLISYDLTEQCRVEVTLFDILGRRVRVVFSGVQGPGTPAPVQVNAAGLASGVYMYRVTADPVAGGSRVSGSGKMILIR